jgi:hypothetical protein
MSSELENALLAEGLKFLNPGVTNEGKDCLYVECPGKHLHTTLSKDADCRIIDDGGAPALHCFHQSCAEIRREKTSALARRLSRLPRGVFSESARSAVTLPQVPLTGKAVPELYPESPELQHEIFLEALFHPGEFFGVVTAEPDGSIRSKGRTYRMPEVDSEQTEKIPNNSFGTWVRVNPLREGGSRDVDVTAWRHVLIESDSSSLELQWAALNASGLPISAVVHSGKKSLHSFVRVDAKNAEEYKTRAMAAADAIERFEGMEVDRACLNPSRLSRFAGFKRGEKMQQLVAVCLGANSWDEWETTQPHPEPTDDFPGEKSEVSNFYFMREQKPRPYLWEQKSGQLAFANETDVVRAANFELGLDKAAAQKLIYRIQNENPIDYAGPMPGYRRGVHRENGAALYCTHPPTLLEPIYPGVGCWPTIRGILRGIFGEGIQFQTVLAHLKLCDAELRRLLKTVGSERSVRPLQAMALVGPRNCGKSFFIEHICVPLLGGRRVDAHKAFSADPEGFNGELMRGETWFIDDREHSTDIRKRRKFATNLKSICFGASVGIHAKNQTPITLKPFGRLFVCCNDSSENLSVLPPITDDIADKIHLMHCGHAQLPPTDTEEQRAALRDAVKKELPHFLSELQLWSIPLEIQHQRTGVLTFQHPEILRQLRGLAPEAELAELIISGFEPGKVWTGSARELKDRLSAEASKNRHDAIRLLAHWASAAGTYLSRIAANREEFEAEFGLRVMRKGQILGVEQYEVLVFKR